MRPNDYRLGTSAIAALRLGVPYELTSSALTILIGLHNAVLQGTTALLNSISAWLFGFSL